MTENRYLTILELQPGATLQEIKKSYRRLSKIYHPDISKDVEAQNKFINLTEAYNFLIQVGPHPNHETIRYNYNPEADAYDHWRAKAKTQARKRAIEEARLQQEQIKKILSGFKVIAVAIIVFNIALSIDFLMPHKQVRQRIESVNPVFESSKYTRKKRKTYDAIQFEDYTMQFNIGETVGIKPYQFGYVQATAIFNKAMSVKLEVKNKSIELFQLFNVYRVFGFLIPIIFFVTYLYKYKMRTLDHKLTMAIFMCFLSFMQFYMFFKF
jgi:hypothetical protein